MREPGVEGASSSRRGGGGVGKSTEDRQLEQAAGERKRMAKLKQKQQRLYHKIKEQDGSQ
jgi:hypothetical protein